MGHMDLTTNTTDSLNTLYTVILASYTVMSAHYCSFKSMNTPPPTYVYLQYMEAYFTV